jgi:hypothetical protein
MLAAAFFGPVYCGYLSGRLNQQEASLAQKPTSPTTAISIKVKIPDLKIQKGIQRELERERGLSAGLAERCEQAIGELNESEQQRHGAVYVPIDDEALKGIPREMLYRLVDKINECQSRVRFLPLRDNNILMGYFILPDANNVDTSECVRAFKKAASVLQGVENN